MRVPPYYRRPGWQRFFAGIAIGAIIGWAFFVNHYGQVYDSMIVKIKTQADEITHLEEDIAQLKNDQVILNEENKNKLTVQDIEISFSNDKQLKLSQLTIHDLKHQAVDQISNLKGDSIETVYQAKDLIYRAIENKTYVIDDRKYHFKIIGESFYTTLHLTIEIKLEPSSN
ncbi:sporulation membrane protein YtrI [Alkalihalobacillus sp. 1P02AB]|uniref:sporulation membrane protein YtrI n=1 Tax=Alkalihalobacillus sp. 1P02AB TaxID=3132260 RepID=UPI0039A523B8